MGSVAFPPQLYPWPTTPCTYTKLGSARDGDTLVVAVGSNASRAVLSAKLADVRGADILPARVVLSGIAVGYSAHVSARGYIPAAPFVSRDARTTLTAFWLEDDQLAALDHTEPNYHRLTVTTTSYPPRELADGVEPASAADAHTPVREFDLYASLHGVLTDGHSTPLPFTTQSAVLSHLSNVLGDPSLAQPSAEVCARLAQPGGAETLTRRIHRSGHRRSDGLAHPEPDDRAERDDQLHDDESR
ncbi:hypothetical protein [Gordonia aichiensis]